MKFIDLFIRPEVGNPLPVVTTNLPTVESKESLYEKNRMMASLTTYVGEKIEMLKKKKSAVDNLMQMTDSMQKKTIRDWRSALYTAKDINQPNRYHLLDLYTELRLDPFLGAVVSYQKNKLKSIDRLIKDENGILDEQVSKLFNSSWFDQFIDNFVEAQLAGFQVLEIQNVVKQNGLYTIDRLDVIPPKNVVPEFQGLKKVQWNYNADYSYANNNYIIELIIDSNRNLGILSRLAPWILFKTLAFKSWGIYTETYALPNMVWKTPIKDKAKNDEFMETIKNLGNNVKILLDKEDDFELIQPSSTDAYQTFAQLIDVVDTTIANEICGGALLFKSGSGGGGGGSYGLSATHEEVSKLKTKSDLSEIARYVNSFLIPKLKRLGLIKPNYNCMFSFSDTENLTRQELITILTPVMQNFDVNKEWLEKALNIKIDNKKNGGAGQSIEEQPQ